MVGSSEYCIFHSPNKEKFGWTEQDFSSLITSKIDRKDCKFSGYIFPWPMDFKNKVFNSYVDFSDAKFYKSIDFSGAVFNEATDFSNCAFKDNAIFKDTIFKKGANFKGANFICNINKSDAIQNCIDCKSTRFNGDVIFEDAVFCGGNANFHSVVFNGDFVSFENSEFENNNIIFAFASFFVKNLYLNSVRFAKGNIDFSNSNFDAISIHFIKTEFKDGKVDFAGSTFKAKKLLFDETKFTGEQFNFFLCIFDCSLVSFNRAEFLGGKVYFSGSYFGGDLELRFNKISNDIIFFETRLSDKSYLFIAYPEFVENKNRFSEINFTRVHFLPFQTFFEGIKSNKNNSDQSYNKDNMVSFQHCQLKDVSFSNCSMVIFSFYRSSFFEDAFFVSCEWPMRREKVANYIPLLTYRRKNQILEDMAYESIKDKSIEFSIDFPIKYSEVADLYRRMKTALDRAKNYRLASWFYFNEIEMKRKRLKERLMEDFPKWEKKVFRGRRLIYSAYRLFAGYGEKPFWSFVWFGIFTLIFSLLHLFNGIKTSNGSFNYDWGLPFPKWSEFLTDFGYSVFFTLYRVIPISYLPYERDKYGLLDNGISDLALSFFNTIILIILIIFIGVGLKRHFRRF